MFKLRYYLPLLWLPLPLVAQIDTVYQTTRQETGEYAAPVVETAMERAFRARVPARWAFKLDMGVLSPLGSSYLKDENDLIGIGIEYKLSPAFSVGADYQFSIGYQPTAFDYIKSGWITRSAIRTEVRWYHDMKRRIAEGRGANNFGGKYLSIEAGRVIDELSRSQLSLRYGVQQRWMRRGFFDLSFGIGLAHDSGNLAAVRPPAFGTDQRLAVGLAVFSPRNRTPQTNADRCDVMRCFDEQYSMLKVNAFNVVNFSIWGETRSVDLRPSLAYERKIGRSPFSVEGVIAGRYQGSTYSEIIRDQVRVYNIALAGWRAEGNINWYYRMRHQILKGRSGNNLSGSFIGLQLVRNGIFRDWSRYRLSFAPVPSKVVTSEDFQVNIMYGIQQRLFDRGFIQFKIGTGGSFGAHELISEGVDQPFKKVPRGFNFNILGELKAGFAF